MEHLRLKSAALLLVGVLASSMLGATRAYFIEPKEANSGWCPHGGNVGQTFVANVDSIAHVEWFVGELSTEGKYEFNILEDGLPFCQGEADVPARGWQWVKCSTFTGGLRFTKGKEYLLKVSHDGGDSVCFVYRTDDPYEWGEISVGGGGWGQPEPVQNCDLVCRVVGVMDAVDSTYWGFNLSPQVWNLGEATLHARADSARVGMSRTEIPWTWASSRTSLTRAGFDSSLGSVTMA